MPELEPEQEYGRDWLAARGEGLLADVMGFGKSAQAITGALKNNAQRIGIACPAVARVNWEREARKWGWDGPIARVTDKGDHTLPAAPGRLLAIASYDGIAGSAKLRGAFNSRPWDVLVLDEAHRLKSAKANRTRAVYGTQINGQRCLVDKALQRWLLSASPMPNDAGELWSHFHALWPGLIRDMSGGSMGYDQFLERYCTLQRGEYGVKVVGYRDREGLVQLLDQIMLRRDEIRGLPDLVLREDPTVVEVSSQRLAELEAHDDIEALEAVLRSADARANDLEGIEDEFIHLATLRRLTGILKAEPVADLVVQQFGPGAKVVLFGIHREVLERMETRLRIQGVNTTMVHGGVPDGMRNTEIDRFNEDPSIGVFLGQIEACKECINLVSANWVRLVEASWSPETNAQAIARVHRKGQMRQVFADFLAIAGSIDETVMGVLALKTRNIKAIMKDRYDGKIQ